MAETATADAPVTIAPATTTAPAASTAPGTTAPASPPASWHDSLPDGLKGEKTLRDFKDPAALAQSYLEMKRWQSGATKIPGADAKPEERSAFYEKLGRPKSPEGYSLDNLKGLPFDKSQIGKALQQFHSLNFTQEQVEKLLPWAHEREQQVRAQQNEAHLQTLDKLADEWGKAVFDQRAQYVDRLVNRFFSEGARKAINDAGLQNHPELFNAFWQMGAQFAEDGVIDGMTSEVAPPEQLKDKIASIRAEMAKEPGETPRFRELMAQMEQEYKKLYPVK